jgi:hypothetical protein
MRLNGWQRIGIVASVIWVPTTGMARCCGRAASGKNFRRAMWLAM